MESVGKAIIFLLLKSRLKPLTKLVHARQTHRSPSSSLATFTRLRGGYIDSTYNVMNLYLSVPKLITIWLTSTGERHSPTTLLEELLLLFTPTRNMVRHTGTNTIQVGWALIGIIRCASNRIILPPPLILHMHICMRCFICAPTLSLREW